MPPYYGAAPLFGVKGSVFVGHGATSGDDLINAIETMKDFEEKKVNEKMIVFFKKINNIFLDFFQKDIII